MGRFFLLVSCALGLSLGCGDDSTAERGGGSVPCDQASPRGPNEGNDGDTGPSLDPPTLASTVQLRGSSGVDLGDGVVITNWHVCTDDRRILTYNDPLVEGEPYREGAPSMAVSVTPRPTSRPATSRARAMARSRSRCSSTTTRRRSRHEVYTFLAAPDGALSTPTPYEYVLFRGPTSFVVEPTGRYMFVGNGAASMQVFTLDAETGVPSFFRYGSERNRPVIDIVGVSPD